MQLSRAERVRYAGGTSIYWSSGEARIIVQELKLSVTDIPLVVVQQPTLHALVAAAARGAQ
ncbi:predicted protein [Coccidioides posadasii str. Silveira]|uniref:Predicted protein n=1 Tax=Coccidioides posadasii (strain RMSCC 757 / Silveira) TaxID=443226 RepID=E9CXH5_COCPS|nr:predicted protein [Coccidioides posadasii str. Silveira]